MPRSYVLGPLAQSEPSADLRAFTFYCPALAGVPVRGDARAQGSGSRAKCRTHASTSRDRRRGRRQPGHAAVPEASWELGQGHSWALKGRPMALPLECRLSPRRCKSQKREHVHGSGDSSEDKEQRHRLVLEKQVSGSAMGQAQPQLLSPSLLGRCEVKTEDRKGHCQRPRPASCPSCNIPFARVHIHYLPHPEPSVHRPGRKATYTDGYVS